FGIPSMVSESPFKIYIGNIPTYLTDDQVIELLLTFGQLKSFILVKDNMTGTSKGFAFCEYSDTNVTDIACTGLNNMELGDRRIIVQRASVGSRTNQLPSQMMGMQPGVMPMGVPGGLLPSNLTGDNIQPTTILQLLNMVGNDELVDDEEYNDILEDVRDECGKFGTVEMLKIPRPVEGVKVNGVGKIFVKFQNVSEATTALRALAGRKFADRTVIVSYLTESDFYSENF
ncbi:Splicing factor U2AF 50 kDa subunit, partial [Smittium culicis]